MDDKVSSNVWLVVYLTGLWLSMWSVKLSELVPSPPFHTSRRDWLTKKPLWRVSRAPATPAQCLVRHLGLDVCRASFTRRFPQPSPFASGQPSFCRSAFPNAHRRVETKGGRGGGLMALDGMMTNTNWDWLTAEWTSALRENVTGSVYHSADFSQVCQLWSFKY